MITGSYVSPACVEPEVRLRKILDREVPSETPFLHSSVGQSALVTTDTVYGGKEEARLPFPTGLTVKERAACGYEW